MAEIRWSKRERTIRAMAFREAALLVAGVAMHTAWLDDEYSCPDGERFQKDAIVALEDAASEEEDPKR